MQNQSHIFDEFTMIFSQERLNGYLRHDTCNNSKTDALVAYFWNIELSQAFYPALQILEITLRNSMHKVMTESFQTEYWYELSFLHNRERARVNQAKESLKKDKKPLEIGRVVAELSFCFWTSLFDVRYEHSQVLWPKLLKPTFPFLPKAQRTRSFLSRELNRIRVLRNRIFHYEPIWHWRDLPDQHYSIINISRCLSPVASKYLSIFDQFPEIYTYGRAQVKINLGRLLEEWRPQGDSNPCCRRERAVS